MRICNKDIERVLIVDDDSEARDTFAFPIEELELEPIKFPGPILSTKEFTTNADSTDAVLCDFHLKKHSYSKFNGDILMAACFSANIPGVLCSTFTDVDFTISRKYLRYIPSLLKSSSPDPTEICDAWTRSLEEMNGVFVPSRRPWRTQLRIDEVDEENKCAYAIIPAWDAHRKIRIESEDVPEEIYKQMSPDKILHTVVNIGAEGYEDLYFDFDLWESE